MINDSEAYARLWTALIAVSPVILIGVALLVVAFSLPEGRDR